MCHWVGVCVPTSSSVKTGVGIERALALPPSQVIIGWASPARGAGGPETPIFNSLPVVVGRRRSKEGARRAWPKRDKELWRFADERLTRRVTRRETLSKYTAVYLSWPSLRRQVIGFAPPVPTRGVTVLVPTRSGDADWSRIGMPSPALS